jgi:phage terminase small subunit|tara:strand:- start:688 stop:1134 length:447 start_codon:yes stop_codon:yes gene_type:complete
MVYYHRFNAGTVMALNDKQEKFAQAYCLNRNATDAARTAGYSKESAYNQGYRLLQNEEVQERIAELEKELTTDVDVVSEIEAQYTVAKANNNGNSALKALELLSRIRGNKSDKENVNTPEQLEEKIVTSLKILGKEKVITLLKKCDFI